MVLSISRLQSQPASPSERARSPFAATSLRTERSGDTPSNEQAPSLRELSERRSSVQLAQAGLSLTRRIDAADTLVQTVEQLQSIARQIKAEPDGAERARLQQEAQQIVADAEASFQQALEDDPSLDDSAEFLVTVEPGRAGAAGGNSVRIALAQVFSPAQAGLTGIDFSDGASALNDLEGIEAGARSTRAALGSAEADIASVIRTRGSAAEQRSSSGRDLLAEAEALSRTIADAASSLVDASGPIEADTAAILLDTGRGGEQAAAPGGRRQVRGLRINQE